MTITPQHLIALLPLLIVGLAVVVVMLCIAARRNHFMTATTTVIGLNLALLSLYFVIHAQIKEVTPLLYVDGYSVFYMGLVIIAGLAISTFAYAWLQGYAGNKDEFYLLILLATLGGIILACANHVAALFIGIELISLPLFGLVGYAYQQKRSLEASIKYTILSAAASSFLLFGIALIYAQTGDLSFAGIGKVVADQQFVQEPLILMGFGLLLVGFCFKLSLIPFHLWTPDVYQGAPAPVSAFLATTSKIAIFAVLLRLFLVAPATNDPAIIVVLSIIAFCSILFGNLLALTQSNIKRMLGYSSIAHLGYLLVALIAVKNHQLAAETASVYLAGYLLSSLVAFGVVSIMSSPSQGNDAESLYAYRGLFWYKPVLAAVMTMAMLSLAGIPMTLGFIGKFYVIASGVNAHYWWLTAAVVIGSAIGLYYYLRMMVSMFLRESQIQREAARHSNWALTAGGIVVLLCAILVLFLGLYPQPLIDIVQWAAPSA